MSQELRVLQCFDCNIFQVDIVKKSSKWQCRICNTRQSVRKELFRGTGKECRFLVQKLNMEKGKNNHETPSNIVEFLDGMYDNTSETDLNHDVYSKDILDHNIGNDQIEFMGKTYQHPSSNSKFNVINFSQTIKWSAKSAKEDVENSSDTYCDLLLKQIKMG